MTFTFNEALVAPLDRIRANIGDTLDDQRYTPILSDERILAVYAQQSDDELATTVAILNQIVAQYARKVSGQIGPYRKEEQQLYDHYKELRDQFTVLLTTTTGATANVPFPAVRPEALATNPADGPMFRRRMLEGA